jgi:hypothetical protein
LVEEGVMSEPRIHWHELSKLPEKNQLPADAEVVFEFPNGASICVTMREPGDGGPMVLCMRGHPEGATHGALLIEPRAPNAVRIMVV